MTSNWKDILRAQEEDLQRMEEMDAALNDDQIDLEENITSILKSTNSRIRQPKPVQEEDHAKYSKSSGRGNGNYDVKLNIAGMGMEEIEDIDEDEVMLASSRSESVLSPSGVPQGSGKVNAKQAPDTAARIQKARLKALTKQLEDSKDMRKQLLDQVNDLQKQLKNERDDNKQLRKRIQLLETDNRRNSSTPRGGRARGGESGDDEVADLRAEIANLKKDLQTAERIAKQADTLAKTKDTQLKRAMETISRNKSQLEDLQSQLKVDGHGDKSKLDEAQSRIRTLERHRDELVDAFRKQMKLIDILKRQKTHMEAARLLQFTEEEFVKILDWAA